MFASHLLFALPIAVARMSTKVYVLLLFDLWPAMSDR